jgi:hypothetical protein
MYYPHFTSIAGFWVWVSGVVVIAQLDAQRLNAPIQAYTNTNPYGVFCSTRLIVILGICDLFHPDRTMFNLVGGCEFIGSD